AGPAARSCRPPRGASPRSPMAWPAAGYPLLRLPSPAERPIEVHDRHELVAARLGKADLRGKELLLGLEHLEVRGQARGVSEARQPHGFLIRGDRARPLSLGLDELRPVHERPGDLAERVRGGRLVLDTRLPPLRPGGLVAALDAADLEYRAQEAGADAPGLALGEEVIQLGADVAEETGEAHSREEVGLGHADVRVRRDQELLR